MFRVWGVGGLGTEGCHRLSVQRAIQGLFGNDEEKSIPAACSCNVFTQYPTSTSSGGET